jgi:hypothetical protein
VLNKGGLGKTINFTRNAVFFRTRLTMSSRG